MAAKKAAHAPALNTAVDPGKFVKLREVSQRLSVSSRTVLRMVEDGRFPAPIAISTGRKAWLEAEVLAWQRNVIARSREANVTPTRNGPTV